MQGNAIKQDSLGLINLFEVKNETDIESDFLNVNNLLEKSGEVLGKERSKSVLGEKCEYERYSEAQIFVLDKYSGQVSVLPLEEKDVQCGKDLQVRQYGFNYVLDKMIDIANQTEDGFNDRFVFQFVPSYYPNGCFSISGLEYFKNLTVLVLILVLILDSFLARCRKGWNLKKLMFLKKVKSHLGLQILADRKNVPLVFFLVMLAT